MRSAIVTVAASDVPSGARRFTSKSLRSSVAMKFFPTTMKSGMVLNITPTLKATIALRCPIDHTSILE